MKLLSRKILIPKVSLIALAALAILAALTGGLVYWRVSSLVGSSLDDLGSSFGERSFAGDFDSPKTYNEPLVIKLIDEVFSIAPLNASAAQAG